MTCVKDAARALKDTGGACEARQQVLACFKKRHAGPRIRKAMHQQIDCLQITDIIITRSPAPEVASAMDMSKAERDGS